MSHHALCRLCRNILDSVLNVMAQRLRHLCGAPETMDPERCVLLHAVFHGMVWTCVFGTTEPSTSWRCRWLVDLQDVSDDMFMQLALSQSVMASAW